MSDQPLGGHLRVPAESPQHTDGFADSGRGAAVSLVAGHIVFDPPAALPATGWSRPVGAYAGQAHTLVRATSGPAGSVFIDEYLFVDCFDDLIGAAIQNGSGAADTGWFPEPAMRELAEAAGLGFRAETVASAAQLRAQHSEAGDSIDIQPLAPSVTAALVFGMGVCVLIAAVITFGSSAATAVLLGALGAAMVIGGVATWFIAARRRRELRRFD